MSTAQKQTTRILIIDDDDDGIRLLTTVLTQQSYQVFSARDGEAGLKAVTDFHPHLILLDVQMPGLNGVETLKKIRRLDPDNYISIIFVTGNSDTSDVIRGLDEGADDYVIKPYNLPELMARIRAKLRIKELHDELKTTTRRLEELSQIDDLTGLLNMRALYQKLNMEYERARRYSKSIACIMMDMDNFKSVNDSNDHLFGSWILLQVSNIIREAVRSIDLAARYGGDEFIIILPDADLQGAVAVASRIKVNIENEDFKNKDQKARLTSSFGVAAFHPKENPLEAKDFIREADRMLYEAKQSGRNCIKTRQL